MDYDVLLPGTPELEALIDRGSGIVSSRWHYGGKLVIDFEGGRYHQANIVTFADRAYHAAGRHQEKYPTAARMYVRKDDVILVGSFDGERVVPEREEVSRLAAWIGCSITDLPEQLRRSDLLVSR